MKIILKDGGFYEITDNQIKSWNAIYKIDVMPCLNDIQNYFLNNPLKRKTSKGLLKYINGVLENEKHKQFITK